jgi:protein-S-isoprenylcysteine O-methyltransferase Ste14
MVAFLLGSSGLLFGIWSNVVQNTPGGRALRSQGLKSSKNQHLVGTAVQAYQNPMLRACLFYYAIAIYLDSIFALAAVALFMTCMLIFVKLIEEPRLLKDFGSDYQEYRRRVSMFFPWFPNHPRSDSHL